ANWTLINQGLPSNRVARDIYVHPFHDEVVYVVYSGFGVGHVFRSVDSGDNWQDISSNLPNLSVNAILVDPFTPGTYVLYVGTDLGVFRSLDDGASWERFSVNLPNTRVEDLIRSPVTGEIIAATHGRGMWRLRIP